MTAMVLRGRPELYSETVLDAKLMAEALDGVWRRLDTIVRSAEQKTSAETVTRVPQTERSWRESAHGAV